MLRFYCKDDFYFSFGRPDSGGYVHLIVQSISNQHVIAPNESQHSLIQFASQTESIHAAGEQLIDNAV